MKLVNFALSITPLLAASIEDDYGTCLPGRTSCDYRDPKYMLFCEGGRYARYKCEEEDVNNLVITANFWFSILLLN
ncbi:hypothetical protein CONCODRAFT_8788 [Conidiobolus coronatus NRRL 28638]|uniref:Uncharacterized protein n=1 Tax=Conidiobolus coronatus (strain ATCC 28846 / CBS 209.66 / NRRL 28638) TaxID=796925 RepID=A0A137P1W7_CONC2|nr:hypothetical protein CONCODRAFT_8788 [Conidiobolus coronatus NRRL 28638]|eukprot:KXN68879.1 hypothetical protein CONCODRAFT_8788 [Conidiobolus coronatus NRRL 28638]